MNGFIENPRLGMLKLFPLTARQELYIRYPVGQPTASFSDQLPCPDFHLLICHIATVNSREQCCLIKERDADSQLTSIPPEP